MGVGTAEFLLVRRTPDWYTADTSTPEQRATAADRVEYTLRRLYDWSAGRHGRGTAGRPPVVTPIVAGSTTSDVAFPLAFTDEQLNAYFDRWTAPASRRSAIDRYIKDPRVIVQDGHIIVAGQLRDAGVIVSLFLDPVQTADGRVQLTLAQVMAGVVQVPQAFFSSQRTSLEHVLAASLPGDQAKAALTSDGLANGAMATAAMDQMLLAVLRGRPTEPVIFVPTSLSPTAPLLPVRITAATAARHTLSMTAQAIPTDERPALLSAVKVPDDPDGTATAKVATP